MHVGSIAEMTILEEQNISQPSRPVPPLPSSLGVVVSKVEKDVNPSSIFEMTGQSSPAGRTKEQEGNLEKYQANGPTLEQLPSKQSCPGSDNIHKWLAQVPGTSSPTLTSRVIPPSEGEVLKPRAERRLIWATAMVAREVREYEQMLQRRAKLLSSP